MKDPVTSEEYARWILNGYAWYFADETETPLHLEAKRIRLITRFRRDNPY